MNQAKPKADAATSFPIPNFVPALTTMQKELFDTFEGINRQWVSRIESEAKLAADLVSKLTQPIDSLMLLRPTRNVRRGSSKCSPKTVAGSWPIARSSSRPGTRIFAAPQVAGT
jgi:hypothetical protein